METSDVELIGTMIGGCLMGGRRGEKKKKKWPLR